MNDNNIDQFREEIRKRLRQTRNETSDTVVVNLSKFNEELELHLTSIREDVPESIYDIIIQTSNNAYLRGVQAGLMNNGAKVKKLATTVKDMERKSQSSTISIPDNTPVLQEINKTLQGLGGLFVIGIGLLLVALIILFG